MLTFFLTLIVFAVAAVALGIGLLVDGRRLQGSCGATGNCFCDAVTARHCPRRTRHGGRPETAATEELDPPQATGL